jgi:hypothetical protein
MKTMKLHLHHPKRVIVSLVLAACCVLTLSGCDDFYDLFKFGDKKAEAQVGIGNGNRVVIRTVDLDNFRIMVSDDAQSPQISAVLGEATQYTMMSDGEARFNQTDGSEGFIELQTNDIVIVRGTADAGNVTVIRPTVQIP